MSTSKVVSYEFMVSYIKDLIICIHCGRLPITPPVYQCLNGHLICESCRNNPEIEKCFLCDYEYQDDSNCRNIVAEKMLLHIPIPCSYQNLGCQLTLIKSDLDHHDKDCAFKPLPCAIPSCTKLIPLTFLMDHIDKEHVKSDTFSVQNSSLSHFLHVDEAFFKKESSWKPTILRLEMEYFLFNCHRTLEGQWCLWVYYVGSHENSTKYHYQITLISTISNEEIMFKGQVVHLSISKEKIASLGYGLIFSDIAAKRFWNQTNKMIKFYVSVAKKTFQMTQTVGII